MDYNVLHSSVIAILSAVITGGFVLVFVEIGNRKNRENDRYRQVMEPFMLKLSAYCRYMSWCVSHIHYPSKKEFTEHEQKFYERTHQLSAMGGRLIVAGGNYQYDDFSATDLHKLCEQINDVWYQYDNMSTKRLSWDHLVPNQDYINKEIAVINPQWLSLEDGIGKVVKVSGEFYADIYCSIEEETFRHELIRKIYRWHSIFVLSALFLVLVSLCLMLCLPISAIILRIITIMVVGLFGLSLFAIFVDEKRQLAIAVKVRQLLHDKGQFNMNGIMKKWSEPAGLIILLGAFIWQMFSVYQTQSIYNDKMYKMETSMYYLLQSDCDQALRDTTRYNGEKVMWVGYNEEHDFMESYFEDRERINTLQDRANCTWWTQCMLYIIGSILVAYSKVVNYKE